MQIKSEKAAIYHSEINIYTFGNGKLPLFCFHGYGNNGRSFEFLEPYLGQRYTFFSIDLPFHGESNWKESFPFKPEDLISLIQHLLEKYNFSGKKISLCGYSLGGRIALALTELMAEKIEKTVLIAPDGLHMNFWYWVGTQTHTGNLIFNKIMQHPKMIDRFFLFVSKRGWASKREIDFAGYYVRTKEARTNLYNRWTFLAKFKPSIRTLRKLIPKFEISVRILFGLQDPIILSKRSEKLKNGIALVEVKTLPANHFLLNAKYAEEIVEMFA